MFLPILQLRVIMLLYWIFIIIWIKFLILHHLFCIKNTNNKYNHHNCSRLKINSSFSNIYFFFCDVVCVKLCFEGALWSKQFKPKCCTIVNIPQSNCWQMLSYRNLHNIKINRNVVMIFLPTSSPAWLCRTASWLVSQTRVRCQSPSKLPTDAPWCRIPGRSKSTVTHWLLNKPHKNVQSSLFYTY